MRDTVWRPIPVRVIVMVITTTDSILVCFEGSLFGHIHCEDDDKKLIFNLTMPFSTKLISKPWTGGDHTL